MKYEKEIRNTNLNTMHQNSKVMDQRKSAQPNQQTLNNDKSNHFQPSEIDQNLIHNFPNLSLGSEIPSF